MDAKALREEYDKVQFEEVDTNSAPFMMLAFPTKTLKKLFWGLLFGSLVGVLLLAPESSFSVRLREHVLHIAVLSY